MRMKAKTLTSVLLAAAFVPSIGCTVEKFDYSREGGEQGPGGDEGGDEGTGTDTGTGTGTGAGTGAGTGTGTGTGTGAGGETPDPAVPCEADIELPAEPAGGTCTGAMRNASPFAAGNGSAGNPYKICTEAQFKAIHTQIVADPAAYASKHYLLAASLDFEDALLKPIADSSNPFEGTFDGAGFHIKNFRADTTPGVNTHSGLFSYIGSGGVVKNVVVVKGVAGAYDYAGLVAGEAKGTIKDVFVCGVVYGDQQAGGVVGVAEGATLEGLHASVYVSGLTSGAIGGLAGVILGNSKLTKATVRGRVLSLYSGAGGAIGEAQNSVVEDVTSHANVFGGDPTGGVVGGAERASLTNVAYSSGRVEGGYYVGGIVGNATDVLLAVASVTDADIIAKDSVGGLAGRVSLLDLRYGAVAGTRVHALEDRGGLLVGVVNSTSVSKISDSYARGELRTDRQSGGIVSTTNRLTVERTYVSGEVLANTDGAAVAYDNNDGIFSGVFWDSTKAVAGQDAIVNGTAAPAGLSSLTATQLKTGNPAATFTGWNFTSVWRRDADANDGYPRLRDIAFTPETVTGLRVFASAATYQGDFGGMTPDAQCAADGNKPSSGTYKALIASATRMACNGMDCTSDATGRMDWVLQPDTTYLVVGRNTFKRFAQTNANAVFDLPLESPLNLNYWDTETWMGFNSTWGNHADNCLDWSTNSGGIRGQMGDLKSMTSTFLNYTDSVCSGFRRFICVEQP